MKYSIITWIDVNDQLPDLKKNVLVVCKSGQVRWGMRCEFTNERKVNGKIESTTKIEWGFEENGWEYWTEIHDVIMWAEFPDSEKITTYTPAPPLIQ